MCRRSTRSLTQRLWEDVWVSSETRCSPTSRGGTSAAYLALTVSLQWGRSGTRRASVSGGEGGGSGEWQVGAYPSTRIGCDILVLLLLLAPQQATPHRSSKSRLRGAGLLEGCSQHLHAAPGDEVVLIPPGVSRTLVPLDCALVLQILYGLVVALTVRSDTGAFSRVQKGEVGSW